MLEMIGYLAIVKLVKFPLLQDPSNLLNANNFLEVWNKHGNNIEKQINALLPNYKLKYYIINGNHWINIKQ